MANRGGIGSHFPATLNYKYKMSLLFTKNTSNENLHFRSLEIHNSNKKDNYTIQHNKDTRVLIK